MVFKQITVLNYNHKKGQILWFETLIDNIYGEIIFFKFWVKLVSKRVNFHPRNKQIYTIYFIPLNTNERNCKFKGLCSHSVETTHTLSFFFFFSLKFTGFTVNPVLAWEFIVRLSLSHNNYSRKTRKTTYIQNSTVTLLSDTINRTATTKLRPTQFQLKATVLKYWRCECLWSPIGCYCGIFYCSVNSVFRHTSSCSGLELGGISTPFFRDKMN